MICPDCKKKMKKVDGGFKCPSCEKYSYYCSDRSECSGELSPLMKPLKEGYSWVCGECRANF